MANIDRSSRDLLAHVHVGETVSSVLAHHGFANFNREQLISQSGMPSDFRLGTDDAYLVSETHHRRTTEVRFFERHKDTSYVFWHDNQRAGAELQVIPLETRIKDISGHIAGSLWASITELVASPWVATRFMDAYLFDNDSTQTLPRGARFSMQVEEKYWNGQFLKYGEVTKTTLEVNGRPERRHFVRLDDGGGVFVDEQLHGARRPLYAPVSYLRISSPFQPHRYHPIRHRYVAHLGTDFELPAGTPIFAAQDGFISRMGHDRAAGNFIAIRHFGGFESSYSHLNHLPPRTYIGQRVKAGQKIAEVGCTGYCTSAHLHFAVKRFGQWMNPIFVIRNYPHQYEDKVLSQVSLLRKKLARQD